MAIVYVKTDNDNRIININSSMILDDITGWIEIDEGDGDRYNLARSYYFPLSLRDEYGVYRYKLVDGTPVERDAEEMEVDRPEPPEPEELEESLEEKIQTLEETVQMLTECLLEMSEEVYA